ncbi:MAG: HD domain-containing protein [Anaerococcus sp.]|nr:HD domain-containing protein [Anaerococcus sp.]
MMDEKYILGKLEKAGFESYIVGGYVRDRILGEKSYDVDITTAAKPDQILEIFKDFKTIELGKKFGTIKVLYKDIEYEITTFRKESGYSDKRHPDRIEFTHDIKEDLKRRDFTINAIAVRKGNVIDPFGGRKDLEEKIIRAVGNPQKRIKEDALRSLRAVRFAAKFSFKLDHSLKEAIRDHACDIKDISKERVRDEINKILLLDERVFAMNLMENLGLLAYIFPEISQMKGFDQHSSFHDMDLFDHTMSVLGLIEGDLTTRLAGLFHDTGKISTFFIDQRGEGRFFGHQNKSEELLRKSLKNLSYPKKQIEDIALLVRRHMDNTNTYTKKSIRKLLRRMGEENIYRLFDLQRADLLSTNHKDISNIENGKKLVKEVLEDSLPKSRRELAINGKDLINMGFKQSKLIGQILDQIEDLIIEEKLANEKEQIKQYIKNKYFPID